MMATSIEDFKAVVKQQMRKDPYSFWAKKFDEVVHIADTSVTEFSGGTLCGSVGARLGNNYAPGKVEDYPPCPVCLEIAYNNDLMRAMILKKAGVV